MRRLSETAETRRRLLRELGDGWSKLVRLMHAASSTGAIEDAATTAALCAKHGGGDVGSQDDTRDALAAAGGMEAAVKHLSDDKSAPQVRGSITAL